MIKFSAKITINDSKLKRKQNMAREDAQFMLDTQVLKDSNYNIPKREGYLEKSSILHSRLGKGIIKWVTKYARRLYYNPQYNFSKDINPHAQGLWFEVAKAQNKKLWAKIAGIPYKKIFNGK